MFLQVPELDCGFVIVDWICFAKTTFFTGAWDSAGMARPDFVLQKLPFFRKGAGLRRGDAAGFCFAIFGFSAGGRVLLGRPEGMLSQTRSPLSWGVVASPRPSGFQLSLE